MSYETAAHRFTNLATQHLGIRTHFQKTHKSGIIYKAYENDGVTFPQDHTGAIEGQPSCKNWTSRVVFDVPDKFSAYNQYTDTPAGTYWCTARTERSANGEFSLSVGVPYAHVKWFRGRDTTERSKSTCPDESCCRRPPASLTAEWAGQRLALGAGPLPPAGGHAAGRLPGRGRDRGLLLPAGALRELTLPQFLRVPPGPSLRSCPFLLVAPSFPAAFGASLPHIR